MLAIEVGRFSNNREHGSLLQPQHSAARMKRRDFLRQSALAGLAIAAGVPGNLWAVRGNQLHIRNYNDISSFDPPFQVSGAEGVVTTAIFQSLLQFKANGTWETQLDAAEYFEQTDDRHYAFCLKRGQMFNNGFGEMTADDVKFSLERMIDPKMNLSGRNNSQSWPGGGRRGEAL